MKNPKHNMERRTVTFQDNADRLLWLKAQLGASNQELRRLTGESNGQIAYRLRVLKDTLGLDESVRNRWKNGNHPLMDRFVRDHHAIMMVELDRKVVPRLVHPTPKTIRIKD